MFFTRLNFPCDNKHLHRKCRGINSSRAEQLKSKHLNKGILEADAGSVAQIIVQYIHYMPAPFLAPFARWHGIAFIF
jgi:hypothetical protein